MKGKILSTAVAVFRDERVKERTVLIFCVTYVFLCPSTAFLFVCPVCFSAVLTVCVPCVFQCCSDSLCALCVSVHFWQSSYLCDLCVSMPFWQSSYLCDLCVSVPFWQSFSLCALCVSVPFWQSFSLCALCVSVPFWQSFSLCALCVSVPSDSLSLCVPCVFQCPSDSLSLCVPCVFQCPSDSLPLCGQSVHLGGFSGGIHLHTRSELRVHAHYWKACLGCFCCFHNPTNSDMDYKIFKVHIWFFCRHIGVHVTPLWWICTQKKKTWIIKLANIFCFTPL